MFRPASTRSLIRGLYLPPRFLAPPRTHFNPAIFTTLASKTAFSTTVLDLKKASKPAKGDHHHVPTNEAPAPTGSFDFDEHFGALETELTKIIEKLKDDLSKLRTGRVDPSQFGGVSVVINKASNETSLLRDVAHVVVKGRNISVGVYEAANVKKVLTALQKANLNITPVIDPKNPNSILMPLPPPTKESRMVIVDSAAKIGEKANNSLRNARQGSHKKIKSFRSMRSDDVRKADKTLEKIMGKAGAEAKRIIEGAKKAILEGS